MAHPNERADVVAEIATLRKLQFESEIDATYLGWTLKAKLARERRSNRISMLVGSLGDIERSMPSSDAVSSATERNRSKPNCGKRGQAA